MIHDGLEHLTEAPGSVTRSAPSTTTSTALHPPPTSVERAPRRAQLRSLGRAPQHDLRGGRVDAWIQPAVPVGWIENDGHPVVDGLGFICRLAVIRG